jgi:erythritol transport system ATP-binding protein
VCHYRCRQIAELARTIAHGAEILILDEPNSALSTTVIELLIGVSADLKKSGVSHRVHELLQLDDPLEVLRSGRVVGESIREKVTLKWIVEPMSGRADATDLELVQ